MIFSKKLRKTAASVLALVMVFAMSTGAFAAGALTDAGDETLTNGYYSVKVNYTIEGDLPADAQISIIALSGKETVDHTGNTANNVLWIDQQAATAKTGSFEFQVDANKAGEGFYVKSGVTGGETLPTGYVTIATQAPETPKSSDASISAIKVGTVSAVVNGTTAIATVTSAVTAADIEVTPAANATVTSITPNADNTVFTIVITAEDGTTATHTLTVTVNSGNTPGGGGEQPPAGGTTIPSEDITIGGTQIGTGDGQVSADAVIPSKTPFGIPNAHVVNVEYAEYAANETPVAPTKVVAHNGDASGVETFYTEYVIDGVTKIKLVTVITDETLKASDLTLVDAATAGKTATKLVYGDPSGNGTVGGEDIVNLINYILGKSAPNDHKTRLSADPSGNSSIGGEDIVELINVILGKRQYPSIVE